VIRCNNAHGRISLSWGQMATHPGSRAGRPRKDGEVALALLPPPPIGREGGLRCSIGFELTSSSKQVACAIIETATAHVDHHEPFIR
jgi:hypothetical protein